MPPGGTPTLPNRDILTDVLQLMLMDTPTMYFRAYFAIPESITAPDGRPVNAVRGTLDFISHLVTHHRPDGLIACFDADWRPEFRVRLLPSYKAHRVVEEPPPRPDATPGPDAAASASVEEIPDTLGPQVRMLLEVLSAFGIADGWAPGFEADDAIAAYAARHKQADGGPVDVVTGDRDMFQLIDDAARVRVLNIARGVAKLEVMDDAAVAAKYGLPGGRCYADFAVLRGDPSDGLPGVAGVGEKTAAALINEYGSLTALLAALDDPGSGLKPAARKKLDAARGYLAVASDVVRVRADADVTPVDSALPAVPADPERLGELAERYGLTGPVTRLTNALAAAAATARE
jgi:5'-3' exonuclease